ncbi:tetratricopeptide repeat protein [Caulobacter segnis]
MLFNDVQDRTIDSWATWGEHFLWQENAEEALWSFQQALELARRLLKADPNSFLRARDVAECWDRVAFAHQKLGEPELALEAYAEAFARRLRLSKIEERFGQVTREMALGLMRLAVLFAFEDDIVSALKISEHSISTLRMRDWLKSDDEQRMGDLVNALRVAAKVRAQAGLCLWAQTYRLEASSIEFRIGFSGPIHK